MEAGAHDRRSDRPSARLRAASVADYVEMTKPKVQSLLLFTTVTTMYVAGDPSLGLVALTCLGGALSAGGAGAINHWFDRDLDAQMNRTARPAGRRPAGSPRARRSSTGSRSACASFVFLALTRQPARRRALAVRLPRLRASSTRSG